LQQRHGPFEAPTPPVRPGSCEPGVQNCEPSASPAEAPATQTEWQPGQLGRHQCAPTCAAAGAAGAPPQLVGEEELVLQQQ
jgi:hypothetical protein